MRHVIPTTICALVLLVPMSGCPASGGIALGLWFLFLDTNNNVIAVELLANGEVDTLSDFPPGSNVLLIGDVYWGTSGSSFLMFNDNGMGVFTYYQGTINSRTSIVNGTWSNGTTGGGFTAMRQ